VIYNFTDGITYSSFVGDMLNCTERIIDEITLRGGQTLSLLPKNYQFKSYKFQGYWKLTWLLTLGSVRLVDVHVNWHEHPH